MEREETGVQATDHRKMISTKEKEKKVKRINKSWIALLFGVLLLATLVGVVWARPKAHHAGMHYTITIPAAAFVPARDGDDWTNSGSQILLDSGTGKFVAYVPMLPGGRTVEQVTLIAYDENTAANTCVYLRRLKADGSYDTMSTVCSSGSSATDPRTFTDTTISPDKVWGGHGAYLNWGPISSTRVKLYAVQIQYY